MGTPGSSGYYFPAEWSAHEATWLTFPCHEESFPGKMKEAVHTFMEFVKVISKGEKVRINVHDGKVKQQVAHLVEKFEIQQEQVELYVHPSNDVWCRDHGPVFLINPSASKNKKIIVNWEFNAWGEKYPFKLDNVIPGLIAKKHRLKMYRPGIVMEGGSVECNGMGTLLTTETCLLNVNRNPHLQKDKIEKYLQEFYGVEQVFWLKKGIIGDDTDGHIDNLTRFVREDTVITMVEPNITDSNHKSLNDNRKLLNAFRLTNSSPLTIIDILMPNPVFYNGQNLPASYANFYISNYAVIVPVFNCKNDQVAIDIFEKIFTDRKVIGIDSTSLMLGFGSFHCLSQQEPAV